MDSAYKRRTIDLPRVVVTGMGAITAIGETLEEISMNLRVGNTGTHQIRTETLDEFAEKGIMTQVSGEIDSFDYKNHVPARTAEEGKSLKRMAVFSQFGLAAANQAFNGAKLAEAYSPERMGCIFGTGAGSLKDMVEGQTDYLARGARRVDALLIPKFMPNAVAANIMEYLGMRGVSFTVNSACSSSGTAIIAGAEKIQLGEADAVIVGGTEAARAGLPYAGFERMGAVSTNFNTQPARASRPFDVERDGLVMGEGAAALVLERYDSAIARGATIYAELAGYGSATDKGVHIALFEGEGLERSMRLAIESSRIVGVGINDIASVYAHATSTPDGDANETRVIEHIFGNYAPYIVGPKAFTGHPFGAAVGMASVFGILGMHVGYVPPNPNLDRIEYDGKNAVAKLNYAPQKMTLTQTSAFLTNGGAFGNHMESLVFAIPR